MSNKKNMMNPMALKKSFLYIYMSIYLYNPKKAPPKKTGRGGGCISGRVETMVETSLHLPFQMQKASGPAPNSTA